MFAYHVRLAWLSFLKTPVLSFLIVSAIGLGIGVCISILTVYALMINDPIPAHSSNIFTYKLNNQRELIDGRTASPASPLVGYRDAVNIMESEIPANHSVHYPTTAVYYPEVDGQSPLRAELRLASSGFFAVHKLPFIFGNAWTPAEEESRLYQTVLTKELNEQVFDGKNSIGEELKIGSNLYKVVGVLDSFKPMPFYFEVDGGAFSELEGAIIPFSLTPELGLRKRGGSVWCNEDPAEDTWLSFLEAECNWIHHWVEIQDQNNVNEFHQFLNNYSLEQRNYGRFMGPYEHEIHNVMSWLEDREVVNKDYEILLSISFLFLVVCLLNCIGLLLAKFLGKSNEMSLRRAVGASRKMIFRQHLVEISLIGFLGGILGLVISLAGLMGIRMIYSNYESLTHLNLDLVLLALALAIASTMLAGIIPAWRVCRLPVSQFLKSQ